MPIEFCGQYVFLLMLFAQQNGQTVLITVFGIGKCDNDADSVESDRLDWSYPCDRHRWKQQDEGDKTKCDKI